MSLNDNIEPISEQTANELFDVIKRAHHIAEESNNIVPLFVNSVKIYNELRARQYALHYSYLVFIYSEKMKKATFITRWYWKKKLNKAEIKLNKIEEWLNKFNDK